MGEVAGAAANLAGLNLAVGVQVDGGADGVAIGFCADEVEAEAAVSGELVVAIETGGAVVGGEEEIEIAVAVEIGDGETAAYLGLSEVAAELGGNFEKFCVALIEEELWGLSVADVAADVADSVVDVAVGHGEIEAAVEIGVKEHAAEAESVARGGAEAGWHGDIVERFSVGAIEAEHFVVEIGDDDAGLA